MYVYYTCYMYMSINTVCVVYFDVFVMKMIPIRLSVEEIRISVAPSSGQSKRSSRSPYLMRMMTEGVWAIAPIMLHTQITHRKVRKAC